MYGTTPAKQARAENQGRRRPGAARTELLHTTEAWGRARTWVPLSVTSLPWRPRGRHARLRPLRVPGCEAARGRAALRRPPLPPRPCLHVVPRIAPLRPRPGTTALLRAVRGRRGGSWAARSQLAARGKPWAAHQGCATACVSRPAERAVGIRRARAPPLGRALRRPHRCVAGRRLGSRRACGRRCSRWAGCAALGVRAARRC